MKIIDCITYFNEPLLFELRLNILEKFVDEFIVCEARYTHAGEKKKLGLAGLGFVFPEYVLNGTHVSYGFPP